uniref:Retinoid X receptor gamma n=1 Tax=Equus caballus TaxID=9796 RepID=A0A9L0T174_HORSE
MYGNYSHFMKFPTGFGGSPGHSGSTSMSPSAALSTGKPMDSHSSYTDTPVSAPRTLSAVGTPLNALGSPYRVITSAMGPPSGTLAAPPGINLVAPPSSQGCKEIQHPQINQFDTPH